MFRFANAAGTEAESRAGLPHFYRTGWPMTPLATRFANELTLPTPKRSIRDEAGVLKMIGGDLHCFEVTAIGKPIHDALDAENLWPDVESMLPRAFLPSPVTWLEYQMPNQPRLAWVLEDVGEAFRISMAYADKDGEAFSLPLGDFRARGILEPGERVEVIDRCSSHFQRNAGARDKFDPYTLGELAEVSLPPDQRIPLLNAKIAHHERELSDVRGLIRSAEAMKLVSDNDIERTIKLGIAFSVLALDLINTPGLIGLRERDPHRGIARKLASLRSGSYPLRSWSEVVLKHQTRVADPEAERLTGTTYHKCFHFVRSHLRHYRDGKVTVIPAHWRGDPALGIKRTRYLVAA
jgi:hypothetical protein